MLALVPSAYAESSFVFQQGVGGYVGTVDTTLVDSDVAIGSPPNVQTFSPGNPDPARVSEVLLSGQNRQVLIRFDGIFGAGINQIPVGSSITSATLQISTWQSQDLSHFSNASQLLYRMVLAWNDSVTWNSAIDGMATDGIEASVSPDDSPIGNTFPVEVDVTSSLVAWAAGGSNQGWVMFSGSTDDWLAASSESTTPPRLTVIVAPEPARWHALCVFETQENDTIVTGCRSTIHGRAIYPRF